MKKLFFTLMILVASQMMMAQNGTINIDSINDRFDSTFWDKAKWNSGEEKVRFANFKPTRTVRLIGDSTEFILTFDYDSLKVSGDMPMDEAAKIFMNYCEDYFYTKIDSLEEEIYKLKK